MDDSTFPIPDLPNELIVEILTWLPGETPPQIQVRLQIMASPNFQPTIRQISPPKLKIRPKFNPRQTILQSAGGNLKHCSIYSLLCESVSEASDLSYPVELDRCVWLVASCDGLILVVIDKINVFLWNPSTRASKKLPHFTEELALDYNCNYSLLYDKSSDDYKVVGCFDDDSDMMEVMVLVYSLRTDQWKRIIDMNGFNLMVSVPAFAYGKLYWIAFRDYLGTTDTSEWDFLALDLVEEEFEVLQMPSNVKNQMNKHPDLHVFDGSLHLLSTSKNCADLWILDGCGVGVEKWTKVVSIPASLIVVGRTFLRRCCMCWGMVCLCSVILGVSWCTMQRIARLGIRRLGTPLNLLTVCILMLKV